MYFIKGVQYFFRNFQKHNTSTFAVFKFLRKREAREDILDFFASFRFASSVKRKTFGKITAKP